MSDKGAAQEVRVIHDVPVGEHNDDWKHHKAHIKGVGHAKGPSNRCARVHRNAWHEEPMRDHQAHQAIYIDTTGVKK